MSHTDTPTRMVPEDPCEHCEAMGLECSNETRLSRPFVENPSPSPAQGACDKCGGAGVIFGSEESGKFDYCSCPEGIKSNPRNGVSSNTEGGV